MSTGQPTFDMPCKAPHAEPREVCLRSHMSTLVVSSKGQTVLPAEVRRRLGMGAGARIEVPEESDGLKLRVVRSVATADMTDMAGMFEAPARGAPCRLQDFDPASLLTRKRRSHSRGPWTRMFWRGSAWATALSSTLRQRLGWKAPSSTRSGARFRGFARPSARLRSGLRRTTESRRAALRGRGLYSALGKGSESANLGVRHNRTEHRVQANAGAACSRAYVGNNATVCFT